METANQERMQALVHLIKLIDHLKDKDLFDDPEFYTLEMEATYFLQERKLSPYRKDHRENIKELIEAVNENKKR